MRVTFDPAKRAKTLAERGLDFEDATVVFQGTTVELEDKRRNYGETLLRAVVRSPGRNRLHSSRHGSPHIQHAKGQRS